MQAEVAVKRVPRADHRRAPAPEQRGGAAGQGVRDACHPATRVCDARLPAGHEPAAGAPFSCTCGVICSARKGGENEAGRDSTSRCRGGHPEQWICRGVCSVVVAHAGMPCHADRVPWWPLCASPGAAVHAHGAASVARPCDGWPSALGGTRRAAGRQGAGPAAPG